MNTNPTLQDRAVEAAARFLEVRGYETLATGWKSPETRGTIDLVARDPESDDLVFVDVSARPNSGAGFGDGRNDRETMELLAVSWLVENDFAESVGVRFDKISMIVVGEDRALLRHHINAFSCGVEQPTSIPAPAGGPGAPRGPRGALSCFIGRSP